MMETPVHIVLAIPGPWPPRSHIVVALAGENEGLMFVGDHLFNPATREIFDVDVYEPNPHLMQAFALAGRRSLSEEDLDSIARTRTRFTSSGRAARRMQHAASWVSRVVC
jgi:glyoxylase-like metal-dependent hydrolase (beta-lactamase superfamily II)